MVKDWRLCIKLKYANFKLSDHNSHRWKWKDSQKAYFCACFPSIDCHSNWLNFSVGESSPLARLPACKLANLLPALLSFWCSISPCVFSCALEATEVHVACWKSTFQLLKPFKWLLSYIYIYMICHCQQFFSSQIWGLDWLDYSRERIRKRY